MNVSVLCPSRGNPGNLFGASLASLIGLADAPHSIEFLVRIDDDDPLANGYFAAAQHVHAGLVGGRGHSLRLFTGPRMRGYNSLHEYFNRLAAASTGRWMLLWNDDAIMETPRWDKILADVPGKYILAHPKDSTKVDTCFPAFTRGLVEIQDGVVSRDRANDSWLCWLFRDMPDVNVQVPIFVRHARALSLETLTERAKGYRFNRMELERWRGIVQQRLAKEKP